MPAPRTTRDLERSLDERERRIVLNRRNRGVAERLSVTQAAQRAGEFVRAGQRARRGPAGPFIRPGGAPRNAGARGGRQGLFGRIAQGLRNFRGNRNAARAARNRGRAANLRNRRG